MTGGMKALEIIHESRGKKFLFSVETAYAADNYSKYEELRREIWGDPEDYFASACNMASESFFHEGGSLFIGVFTEDGQAGTSGGFYLWVCGCQGPGNRVPRSG